jgi:hypothetical protein
MSLFSDNVNADATLQPSIVSTSGGEGNSAAAAAASCAVVFPVGDSAPDDFAQSLFSNGVNSEDIPSQHICPLVQEPPYVGVYFDVPAANGSISEQIFKQSALYRWIATPGTITARCNVNHPINQQSISPASTIDSVCPVTNVLQELLHQERGG